ncbi:hypothetical protein ACTWQB_14825 [Piscibacillus sp. B03]|uniref:hypothetical protein n=1 Tax=Piscibacillus sp. B03 TaxID=3457430 RepID=UPI003FCCC5E2
MQISVDVNKLEKMKAYPMAKRRYSIMAHSMVVDECLFLNFETPEQALEWLEQAKHTVEQDLGRGEQDELRRAN